MKELDAAPGAPGTAMSKADQIRKLLHLSNAEITTRVGCLRAYVGAVRQRTSRSGQPIQTAADRRWQKITNERHRRNGTGPYSAPRSHWGLVMFDTLEAVGIRSIDEDELRARRPRRAAAGRENEAVAGEGASDKEGANQCPIRRPPQSPPPSRS